MTSINLDELNRSELIEEVEKLQAKIAELQKSRQKLEDKVSESTQEASIKESNLRTLIHNYRSPIWMVDTEFKLIEFNSVFAAAAKLVYDMELRRGLPILEELPREHATLWRQRYMVAMNGEIKTYQHSQEVAGKMEHYDTIVYPIYNNEKITGVGVITNEVTDIENSKIKAEQQNLQLSKLNHELDTFFYRSTHDMRAPVATIMGLIELALSEKTIEAKDRCLEFMSKSINRMDLFIREITDITKNNKFELEPTPIDFKELIPEILEELVQGEPYNEVKTTFEVIGDDAFNSDKFRLKTVLRNIISNAIKYRRKKVDSFVKICVKLSKHSAEITIKDNGQGINETQLQHIFDMFHRANEHSEGTGLGLFIVSELIEKLNGSIEVESELGEGSTFKLKLPGL